MPSTSAAVALSASPPHVAMSPAPTRTASVVGAVVADDPGVDVRVLEVEHGGRADPARAAGDVGRDHHRHHLPVGRLQWTEDQVGPDVGECVADRRTAGARQHVSPRRQRPVAPVR